MKQSKQTYILAGRIAFTAVVLYAGVLKAELPVGDGTRHTDNGSVAPVTRWRYTLRDWKKIALYDVAHRRAYPEAELLVRGDDYYFARNCHDFAFGPWMSCCPNNNLPD